MARVCLNTLRSRNTRRAEPVGVFVPDPIVSADGQVLPEDEALMADSVGLALQVVLDSLSPPERLAFVLDDMTRCDPHRSGGPGFIRCSGEAIVSGVKPSPLSPLPASI